MTTLKLATPQFLSSLYSASFSSVSFLWTPFWPVPSKSSGGLFLCLKLGRGSASENAQHATFMGAHLAANLVLI